MKKKLYICNTYYHVFISLIKAIKDNNKSDIMITSDGMNNSLFSNNDLINNLEESKIFEKIILFNYSAQETKSRNIIIKIFNRNYLAKKIIKSNRYNFDEYDEINIFFERCLIGYIIRKERLYYNLIEDGTDYFINNYNRTHTKSRIKKILKKMLNYDEIGESKFVKSIEVNNAKGVVIQNKKIIEVPKQKLIENLSKEEKQIIFNVFLKEFKILKNGNLTLIITQPLSEDKIVKFEKDKILLYRKIIIEYADNDNIIIKTHPRETTNYKAYFPNAYIIDDPFPIEILEFKDDIKFDKIITISSTSISLLNNSNEKIFLGWEWLDNNK